jgi:hypothetical protein
MRRVLVLAFLLSFSGIAVAAEFGPSPVTPALTPQTLKVMPTSKHFDYAAMFAAPVRIEGAVTASGIIWKCGGKECRTSGPWPVPGVGACNSLALREGIITGYGHPDRKLSAGELATCNKGVEAAKKSSETKSASSTKGVEIAKKPSETKSASSTAWSPVSIRTATLQVTGTGALAARLPFTPVNIRTAPLQATGTGSSAARLPFEPVNIRTQSLTVTGTGTH